VTAGDRQALHYTTRRSPYFERTLAAGAREFIVYNHMYMPMDYGRDPREEYAAITERVTLWDVGAERQAELRGPDALALADYLSPRRLSDLEVGACRFTPVCDERGEIIADCIVLRPWPDVVWFSHSDADLDLWAFGLARARGADVEVSQPDVAPMQVQGPRAADVLAGLVELDLPSLERFRCASTTVAGVSAVVSNTGWSREPGYEVYPLAGERAVDVWDAIVEAGRAHGLLVTGPNLNRAVEQGITDTQYRMNSGMNPLEAGLGSLLDLDGDPFVGREALRRVRAEGPRRKTVGLVVAGDPFGPFEDFWPLRDAGGRDVGHVRWAVWSYALGSNIAIAILESSTPDDAPLVVAAPDGDRRATAHPIPFV